jgi:hypothetical protein
MSSTEKPTTRATLGLTGLTSNAMALIAPGAFLWLTFFIQCAYGAPMAAQGMWFGIFGALVLCLATAIAYSHIRRFTRRTPLLSNLILLVAPCLLLAGFISPSFAQAPTPDPAGIATGDKRNVQDAAGNPFVVSEPTDKTAPDYAEKKKAFDEFQAQASKEPLAVKLADSVGHVRIGTNFAWTLNTGYLVLFMQAGVRFTDLRIDSQKERGPLNDAEFRSVRILLSLRIMPSGTRFSLVQRR